jgi:hypothetical protein
MYTPTKSDIAHEGAYLANNMQVVGAGKTANSRLFKNLVCGHEQEAYTCSVRKNEFRCRTCLKQKLSDEASARGLTLHETFVKKNKTYGKYTFNSCGHHHETQVGHVRAGLFKCQMCQDQKFRHEASAVGADYLENIDGNYGRYQLECGHHQVIGIGEIRKHAFRCQTCEKTWANLPSNLYLHKIQYGETTLLKFGRARNVDFRITRYGLAVGTILTVLQTWPTNTGIEADRIETMVSRQFKRYSKTKAKLIFQGSGHTECFHIEDQQAIMDFVEHQVIQSNSTQPQIGLH